MMAKTKPKPTVQQAMLDTLRDELILPEVPSFTTIWLSPNEILVDGIEEEGLEADAKAMRLGIQLFGLGQPPAVVRESVPDEEGHHHHFRYRAIYGRRRILASRGMSEEIEVHCYAETLTRTTQTMLTLVENLNRRPAWIQTIMKVTELIGQGWSDARILATLCAVGGQSRTSIQGYIDIAHLPAPLLAPLLAGDLAQTLAKQIAKLTPTQREALCVLAREGKKIDAGAIRDLFRAQTSAPLQEALLGEPAPLHEMPLDTEGLAAQMQSYDDVLAGDGRYGKARMLLGLLVKELSYQEAQNDAR